MPAIQSDKPCQNCGEKIFNAEKLPAKEGIGYKETCLTCGKTRKN